MGVSDVCRGGVFLLNGGGYNPKDGKKNVIFIRLKVFTRSTKIVEQEAK
jgi:hypothetical protein